MHHVCAVRASAVQRSAVSTGRIHFTNTLENRPENTVKIQFLVQFSMHIRACIEPSGQNPQKSTGMGLARTCVHV